MTAMTPTRFELRTTPTRTPCLTGGRYTRHKTPSQRSTPGDRFIPSRASTDLQFARFKMSNRLTDENSPPDKQMLDQLLGLQGLSSSSKTLGFSSTPQQGRQQKQYWQQYTPKRRVSTKKSRPRKLPKSADRVLDAPNLLNDFYLNVLDWSSTGVLAVALRDTVYLLNKASGAIDQLSVSSSEYVSSLAWNKTGKYLALGTSNAEIQLWDVAASKMVKGVKNHTSRINSLAWNTTKGLLSSGSQKGLVQNMDPRLAQSLVSSTQAHSLDVCGLTWGSGGRLLASGGNDNLVKIWDMYNKDPWTQPTHSLKQHSAAVKALSWCPWDSSTLATGGGSADKTICVWNACTGELKSSRETGAQVSGLIWAPQHKEILSAHGNPTNELAVWSCDPSSFELTCTGHLSGHEDRVLHMVASPGGETVVSAGADETLRFWKIFTNNKAKAISSKTDSLALTNFIR